MEKQTWYVLAVLVCIVLAVLVCIVLVCTVLAVLVCTDCVSVYCIGCVLAVLVCRVACQGSYYLIACRRDTVVVVLVSN